MTHYKHFHPQISSRVNILNVNVICSPSQGLLNPPSCAWCKQAEHAQELCVSRDANKQHMAEGGVPDLVQSPRGLLTNFYFSGKMTKIFPHFFIKRFQ